MPFDDSAILFQTATIMLCADFSFDISAIIFEDDGYFR